MNAEEFACYVAFLFDDAWSDYCMNMPKSIVIGTLIVHVIVEHAVTYFSVPFVSKSNTVLTL